MHPAPFCLLSHRDSEERCLTPSIVRIDRLSALWRWPMVMLVPRVMLVCASMIEAQTRLPSVVVSDAQLRRLPLVSLDQAGALRLRDDSLEFGRIAGGCLGAASQSPTGQRAFSWRGA